MNSEIPSIAASIIVSKLCIDILLFKNACPNKSAFFEQGTSQVGSLYQIFKEVKYSKALFVGRRIKTAFRETTPLHKEAFLLLDGQNFSSVGNVWVLANHVTS